MWVFIKVLLHMFLLDVPCQVSLCKKHLWACWTLVIHYIASPPVIVWIMNQLLMPRHILDQYMLSAILACAFLAVFYSCDITENSVFIKILGRIIVIFFVLHKSCKVVVGHIARGLVAFDTFLVRIYQVIIQRCCICVASVTFSALELAKIAVHGLFMDVAMGCIMENSVTKGARPFLVKGLLFSKK